MLKWGGVKPPSIQNDYLRIVWGNPGPWRWGRALLDAAQKKRFKEPTFKEPAIFAKFFRVYAELSRTKPTDILMKYYMVINGQQAGPYEESELSEQGLTRSTLVWREGLSLWTPAGEVSELKCLFGATPPPITPQYPPQQPVGNVQEMPKISPTMTMPTIEFRANFGKGLTSIGGKIVITPTQLIFRAHGLNIGDLRDRVYEIRDIASYKKRFLTFMDISFSDGETIRLAVGHKQRVIDELETRRESLQVAPQYPPQQPVSSVPEMPKISLFMAIFVTICCFAPFGIVGIVKASKVGRLYTRGDYQAAEKYAKSAGKWIELAFWIGLACWCLILLVLQLVS